MLLYTCACKDAFDISDLIKYSRERLPQKRTFDQDCEVDVGTCPIGSCFMCPDSGYICPQTETRTHTCPDAGTWNYEYVSQCVCCKDRGLTVNVQVVDSETKAGIEGISIRFGNNLIGYSDANGRLMSVISSNIRNLVISATDLKNDNYIPTVQMFDIIEALQKSLDAEIVMVRKTFSLEFDTTKLKTICLSENQNCLQSNDETPKIEFQPKSFRKINGRVYKGLVKVSISILDGNIGDTNEILPNHYKSLSGNIINTVIPQITFAIDFKDVNNNKLRIVKDVNFYSTSDRMWNIDLLTGFWSEAGTTSGTKRRKRQTTDQIQFSSSLESGNWMTLGQISDLPTCYIKARVFDESGVEQSNSLTTVYQPEIITADSNDQKIRYSFSPTKTLESTCFEVSCQADGSTLSLSGIIQLKAFQNVENDDGSSTLAITYLTSKPLDNYDSTMQSQLQAVEYSPTIDSDKLETYAKFISNPQGPFYEDALTCEQSNPLQPAFHFIKSDPSVSFSASTTNAELCTARIGFKDNDGLFFKYLSSLDSLPVMKAVSTWLNGKDRFFFTDFRQIEYSNSEDFYYACVKYRCGPPAEGPYDEGIGDTALYLDLLLPDKVDIDVNNDGIMVEKDVNCKTGNCYGPFCDSQSKYKDDKDHLDASLWVERGNNVPGKLFLPENDPLATDSCSASTITTDFAHTITCYFGNPQK